MSAPPPPLRPRRAPPYGRSEPPSRKAPHKRRSPIPKRSSAWTRAQADEPRTYMEDLTAEDVLEGPVHGSSSPARVQNLGKSFIEHLRHVYKTSVIDVSRGRVRVNFAQLNRVVLECAQKRLVGAVLDFAYRIDDDDEFECFASETEELLSEYGDLLPVIEVNVLSA